MSDGGELDRQLRQADTLRQQGQLAAALAAYQAALAMAPGHVGALYFAALCLSGLGRNPEAVELLARAAALAPHVAQIHADLGAVRSLIAPSDAALASLDRALELDPNHASALANRGKVLMQRGLPEEGLRACNRALALDPAHVVALTNRGTALIESGRYQEALADFDAVLRLTPDDPQGLYNRGAALLRLKRGEPALACLERVVAARPRWAEAWLYLGQALAMLRQFDAALASYRRALDLQPCMVDALNNAGNLLREMKRSDEALAWLDQALAVQPDYAKALYNRGAALMDLKRFADAADAFAALPEGGLRYNDAAGYLLQARTNVCDWTGLDTLRDTITARAMAGEVAAHPFPFLAVSGDPAAELAVARGFLLDKFPPAPEPLWRGERYRHERIRVAYLSADLHGHATAWLMAELFELHDRERFEVTAISFGPDSDDPMRARLRRAFHAFEDVRVRSDEDVARLVRAREIDIAVDLKGITTDSRPGIFALRPAPVQVSYLGYPGTLGVPYMDYIVADPVLIQPEDHTHYSEKIVTLPDSYQVNDRTRAIAANTPPRAELGLPEQGFVFCCFNNNYKIMPDIFAAWMRLLRAVEGSVLWLIEDTPAAAANLRRAAQAHGVAAERLVFASRVALPDHLARQRRADLLLDTLPYNAHTTASDALWAGLPVLTCMGRNFAGRVAASLLRAVGLPELITRSLAEYEALALRLARDPVLLGSIRAKLADNLPKAKLFDTPRFCRHLEAAYAAMWQRQQRGEPPAPIEVAPIP